MPAFPPPRLDRAPATLPDPITAIARPSACAAPPAFRARAIEAVASAMPMEFPLIEGAGSCAAIALTGGRPKRIAEAA